MQDALMLIGDLASVCVSVEVPGDAIVQVMQGAGYFRESEEVAPRSTT
jgi:hypothetical protein